MSRTGCRAIVRYMVTAQLVHFDLYFAMDSKRCLITAKVRKLISVAVRVADLAKVGGQGAKYADTPSRGLRAGQRRVAHNLD